MSMIGALSTVTKKLENIFSTNGILHTADQGLGAIIAGGKVPVNDAALLLAVQAGATARITGTQLGADWEPSWPVSSLVNTTKKNDYTVPVAGGAAKHKLDVVNMSSVSALSGSIFNLEAAFGSDTKQSKLLDFSVPAATATVIENCDTQWSSAGQIAEVTTTADGTLKKVGSNGAKHVVGANFTTGLIAYNSIAAAFSTGNASMYSRVYMWIYTDVALTAGQLQFLMDDTAACASPVETINFPALDTGWTRVRLQLANPTSDLAIISIGLKLTADVGAVTIACDDIQLVAPGMKSVQVSGLFNGCTTARVTLANSTAVDAVNTLQAYARLREMV